MLLTLSLVQEEPRLREWLRWGIPFCFLLALGFGVPAAINMGNGKLREYLTAHMSSGSTIER
jgi:hypothetical protein